MIKFTSDIKRTIFYMIDSIELKEFSIAYLCIEIQRKLEKTYNKDFSKQKNYIRNFIYELKKYNVIKKNKFGLYSINKEEYYQQLKNDDFFYLIYKIIDNNTAIRIPEMYSHI